MGISTHAPLAGRDGPLILHNWVKCSNISTHAPLAGRDDLRRQAVHSLFHISTHAPLAGRDVDWLLGKE